MEGELEWTGGLRQGQCGHGQCLGCCHGFCPVRLPDLEPATHFLPDEAMQSGRSNAKLLWGRRQGGTMFSVTWPSLQLVGAFWKAGLIPCIRSWQEREL